MTELMPRSGIRGLARSLRLIGNDEERDEVTAVAADQLEVFVETVEHHELALRRAVHELVAARARLAEVQRVADLWKEDDADPAGTVAYHLAQILDPAWAPAKRCPECRNGKHAICTGEALDETTDEIVPCDCTHDEDTPTPGEDENR